VSFRFRFLRLFDRQLPVIERIFTRLLNLDRDCPSPLRTAYNLSTPDFETGLGSPVNKFVH
jgi:hypothetical protein